MNGLVSNMHCSIDPASIDCCLFVNDKRWQKVGAVPEPVMEMRRHMSSIFIHHITSHHIDVKRQVKFDVFEEFGRLFCTFKCSGIFYRMPPAHLTICWQKVGETLDQVKSGLICGKGGVMRFNAHCVVDVIVFHSDIWQ